MSAVLLLLSSLFLVSEASSVNKQCRDLLQCSVQRKCVDLPPLTKYMDTHEISSDMYDTIDKYTDYGCIFTTGCQEECNSCPLCLSSKLQIVDILGGEKTDGAECPELLTCASKCVQSAGQDIIQINRCLRHDCAFYCFDGSCPKCSAFVTRIFNQMCVAGEFRKRVPSFKGACFEMFREVVHAKFQARFDAINAKPAIG